MYMLIFLLFIVTIEPSSLYAADGRREISGPEKVLRDFYQALENKNCSKVLQIRPKYDNERCQDIDSVNINRVETIEIRDFIALIYIDVSYRQSKKMTRWAGHTILIHDGKKWAIQDENEFWWNEKKFSLKECKEMISKFQKSVSPPGKNIKKEDSGQPIADPVLPTMQATATTIKTEVMNTPNKTSVSITSQPAGAKVLLDEVYQGETPIDINNLLPGKTILISLSKQGYENINDSLILESGERITLNYHLSPDRIKDSPIDVIRAYYEALYQRDANSASGRWKQPNYLMLHKAAGMVEWYKFNDIRLEYSNSSSARVWVDVTGKSVKEEPKRCTGMVELEQVRGQWKIVKINLVTSVEMPCSLDLGGIQAQEINDGPVLAEGESSGHELTLSKKAIKGSHIDKADELSAEPSQTLIQTKPLIEGFTFGSERILHKLWNPQQLRGSPDDKKILMIQNDNRAPQRLSPKCRIQPLVWSIIGSIRSVTPFGGRKAIALTFDLCERENEITGYDASIINYLRHNGIKATFFAGGKWMRSHPEKTKQLIADPLFEVGNHSWTHANLRVSEVDKIINEILWTQAQYELIWEELELQCRAQGIDSEMNYVPKVPMIFRFPFGTCSPTSLSILSRFGLPAIQWDVVSGDPASGQTAENIAKTVLGRTKDGSIVIFHANGRGHGTAEALPRFIPELRKKGFEFVTVSELLRLGPVDAYQECFELQPGDNKKYDRLFERKRR